MAIEDGFNQVVSVEYNAASDGSISNDEGVVAPVWRRLPGSRFSNLPCRICDDESQRAPGQEFSEDLTTTTMLFSADCGLPEDKTLRFAWKTPTSGDTVYYYANGKVTRPTGAYGRGVAYTRVRARLGIIP